jgi:hypothetical protein
MKLAKTNTELINVKGDLSNTRMDLINKLEGRVWYWYAELLSLLLKFPLENQRIINVFITHRDYE